MSFELATTEDLEIMLMRCTENMSNKWDHIEYVQRYIAVATA